MELVTCTLLITMIEVDNITVFLLKCLNLNILNEFGARLIYWLSFISFTSPPPWTRSPQAGLHGIC